jgi:hypothetical protein
VSSPLAVSSLLVEYTDASPHSSDLLMAALVGPNKATCRDAAIRKCDFLIMELVARLPRAARSFRRRDGAD